MQELQRRKEESEQQQADTQVLNCGVVYCTAVIHSTGGPARAGQPGGKLRRLRQRGGHRGLCCLRLRRQIRSADHGRIGVNSRRRSNELRADAHLLMARIWESII